MEVLRRRPEMVRERVEDMSFRIGRRLNQIRSKASNFYLTLISRNTNNRSEGGDILLLPNGE